MAEHGSTVTSLPDSQTSEDMSFMKSGTPPVRPVQIDVDSVDAKKNQALPGKNRSLERESSGLASLILYSSIFIFLDLFKQIASYGVKFYNKDQYPVPQTFIVLLTELCKVCVILVIIVAQGQLGSVRVSFLYAIPAFIAAVNNNMYYLALHYTTPPMWNILIQLRIIFTGLVYRFFFKRHITKVQWSALCLLIFAIAVTKVSGGASGQTNFVKPMAVLMAVVGSALSVCSMVYAEYLFKNDTRSFADKQLQMYMFGSLGALLLYIFQTRSLSLPSAEILNRDAYNLIVLLVFMCMIFTAGIGLSTAVIMKKLDNIVKLYTQALSNMFTSLACTFLFPQDFHINVTFVFCLIMVLLAISMYEKKELDLPQLRKYLEMLKSKKAFICLALLILTLIIVWSLYSIGPAVEMNKGVSSNIRVTAE